MVKCPWGREVEQLTLAGLADAIATLEGVAGDVMAAGRVQSHTLQVDETVEVGSFSTGDARFAPKPEKKG